MPVCALIDLCRNCHAYKYMDLTRQSVRAQNQHSMYLLNRERTCIDCHKGIVHRLPNVAGVAVAPAATEIGVQ